MSEHPEATKTLGAADLVRLKMYADSLLRATKAALVLRGATEWEDGKGTRSNHEVPGVGSAVASISDDTLAVWDEQAFLEWVREQAPSEVVMVLAARNPEWLKRAKAAWAKEVARGKRDTPPGAKLEMAGRFLTVSVRPDRSLAHRLDRAAQLGIEHGVIPTPSDLFTWADQLDPEVDE